MKWNTHIDKITSKANSMLGFARRNLGSAPRKVKIQAYKSLVRPHVEYCSSVWDPHTNRNIQKIEAIQRRAARFITNNYSRESSVSAMLKEIQLPSLQDRRLNQRIIMMHKIVHNHVDLNLEDYLKFSTRDPKAVATRYHNPLTLRIPFSRTNIYHKSFFPNTAKDWNSLAYSQTSITSPTKFRRTLNAMYAYD